MNRRPGERRFAHGALIGKFLPFHLGHRRLIETALADCDRVSVIVVTSAWHELDLDLRIGWIRESFGGSPITIYGLDQDARGLDDWDSRGWARASVDVLGETPDAVFTSESYGDRWAAAIGCDHVLVDPERLEIGISGTEIRADPLACLEYMEVHVRAHFAKRVCVIGAESTGKSTLARSLASACEAPYVGEFGRLYTEAQPDPLRYHWQSEDFRLIAAVQSRLENDAARWGGPLIVCDTSVLTTAAFHRVYMGTIDPELERLAEETIGDFNLYLLTDVETPFVQDPSGTRRPGARQAMDAYYRESLAAAGAAVIELQGSAAERLAAALGAVKGILSSPSQAIPIPA